MSRLSTINRRAFVGLTAALFSPTATRARNFQPTNLKGEQGEGTGSRLLIGGTDDIGLTTTLGILDGQANLLDTIDAGDSIFSVRTTPNNRRVILELIMASTYLDLDTSDLTPFADTSQLLIPQPAVEGPQSATASHMIAPTFAFDAIMQLDVETGALHNITRYLQGEPQQLVMASATFGTSGTLAGVWTGNNVYLMDPAAPRDAIALNGGDDSMYSTTFAMADNEEWIAYTTYAPADGLGEVILQSTVDGTMVPVIKGTAWSCIQFIPGDATSFLLLHDGAIERRSIDDPTARGERIAPIGLQPGAETVASPDGTMRVLGSRESDDLPTEWTLLDLEANTGTPLPELSGLSLLPISTWHQQPVHALFGSQPELFSMTPQPGALTGLDLATGEIIPLLQEVALDSVATHTSTTTGSQVLIASHPDGPKPGLWYLDLAKGTATEITSTRDTMINGCLSPDGSLAAVTGRDDDYQSEIFLCDPADPTELTSFGMGTALTWS